jgi:hypothetical protein
MEKAMKTRRDFLALAAATPLMTSAAYGQNQQKVDDLFKQALAQLSNLEIVRTKYRTLSYYIELLQKVPPNAADFKPDHIPDAIKTYLMLGTLVGKYDAKFDQGIAEKSSAFLKPEYLKNRTPFRDYLKQVGIQPESPAEAVLEEAIVSMMLFFATVNKITELAQMKWCIFPFCFGRPA